MAKTLLNGVNDVLYRLGYVSSTGALASLTDTGKQLFIDQAVQAWNQTIRRLYMKAQQPLPNAVGSTTLTLATGDRDYDLGLTDMSRIIWPIVDEDNDYFIREYPGGWMALYQDKPLATDWEGRAEYAAIRPTDGQLLLEYTPTADENGLTYTVYYEKDLLMTLAADTVPFNDGTYQDLIPAVAEQLKQIRNMSPDFGIYRISMADAAKSLTQNYPRDRY